MTVLLLATHLAAFVAGGITARLLMLRYVAVREIEGHPAFELKSGGDHEGEASAMPYRRAMRRHTLTVVLIVASLLVLGIGIQAKLAADDNARRDAADRRYADCLTAFAADLIDTIETRTEATQRLEAAERRKTDTLDELLELTLTARTSGVSDESQLDPALVERFERVLEQRVRAQEQYRRVYERTQEIRRQNRYVRPQVVCDR